MEETLEDFYLGLMNGQKEGQMSMFYHHLRNELWKLFGKKRTYIGFGAFLLAQNAMLLMFRFTHWQAQMERMLAGNGYLAQEYVSALTVAVIMLIPQILLLMPFMPRWWGATWWPRRRRTARCA